MENQKEENLYHKFSRKDLQGLCKKHGLPANKSSSKMATSLILYLEIKNIISRPIWEVTRSHIYPLGSSELQSGLRTNAVGDLKEDYCREMASRSASGNNQFVSHRDAQKSHVINCKGPVSSDKPSEDMGTATQLYRGSGSGIPDKALTLVSSTAEAPLPNFTFEVSCEDGIQLYVDLNSSTSDWIESIKGEVDICHDGNDFKSHDSHQDLGRFCGAKQSKGLSLGESHKETNDGQNEAESYPSMVKIGVMPQADVHGGGRDYLPSTEQKSLNNTVRNPDLKNTAFGEEQAMLSSTRKTNKDGLKCGLESCVREDTFVATDSDAKNVTLTRTCNVPGESLPCDPKSSKFAHQSSNTDKSIHRRPLLSQTLGFSDFFVNHGRLSDAAPINIRKPRVTSVQDQDMAFSSLKVGTHMESADLPQNSGVLNFELFRSLQSHGDTYQMLPVEVPDRSQYATPSSPFMNSLSDPWRRVESQLGGVSMLYKPHWNLEGYTHAVNSCNKKARSFPPLQSNQPLGVVNSAYNIEKGKGVFISSPEAGQELVGLQKKGIKEPGRGVESECGGASMYRPHWQVAEAYTHVDSNSNNTAKIFPHFPRNQPLEVLKSTSNIEKGKGVSVSSHEGEAGQELVGLKKKDTSLTPSSDVRPLDPDFPEQNGSNHCLLTNSSYLNKAVHRTQSMTDVRNSGSSRTGDGRESSECLNFTDSMGKLWSRPTYCESICEISNKRRFDNVDDQSQSISSEAKISGTSKLFSGGARASHRRSSRLFTK